ncbi:MAG: STAS domain-containing protein [Sporichthyaceae bacterium]|jgi:anti-sigma B factor antagonist
MIIETETADRTTVIRLAGRLTMVTAPLLRQTLETPRAADANRVVVDLTGTEFIDSSGLGALVTSLKRLRQSGGDLRIAGVREQARTVLRLTNLDQVLVPYDSVADAVASW